MFASTLLCQILLATAVLAIPSSRERLAARIARREAGFTHQSQPNQLVDAPSNSIAEVPEVNAVANATTAKVAYSGNWAGAVLIAKNVRRLIHISQPHRSLD